MKQWIALNIAATTDAIKKLFRQPVGTLLTLLMLGIAVSLPLSLYLGIQSAQNFLGNLTTNPQITVYMDMEADALDTQNIQRTLAADQRLKNVRLIPKDVALQDMQNSLGESNLISILDGNPLPDAFAVTPKTSSPSEIKSLQDSLEKLPMVDVAQIDARWLSTLHNIKTFVERVLYFLAIVLGVSFILITYNTIRLQTLSRKEEIEITKLLGAPSSFIRRPFIYLALFQGLFSMLLGLAFSTWILFRFSPQISEIFKPYGIPLQWRFFNIQELATIVLIIIVLAVLGSWFAVNKHLKEFSAEA